MTSKRVKHLMISPRRRVTPRLMSRQPGGGDLRSPSRMSLRSTSGSPCPQIELPSRGCGLPRLISRSTGIHPLAPGASLLSLAITRAPWVTTMIAGTGFTESTRGTMTQSGCGSRRNWNETLNRLSPALIIVMPGEHDHLRKNLLRRRRGTLALPRAPRLRRARSPSCPVDSESFSEYSSAESCQPRSAYAQNRCARMAGETWSWWASTQYFSRAFCCRGRLCPSR